MEDKKVKVIPVVEKTERVIKPHFEAAPGNYHFVKLDNNRQEIIGSDFEIGPYNAKSYLSRPDQYKVKNEPTKKK